MDQLLVSGLESGLLVVRYDQLPLLDDDVPEESPEVLHLVALYSAEVVVHEADVVQLVVLYEVLQSRLGLDQHVFVLQDELQFEGRLDVSVGPPLTVQHIREQSQLPLHHVVDQFQLVLTLEHIVGEYLVLLLVEQFGLSEQLVLEFLVNTGL